jgi:radical SAM superfamily enzyme YgiQ (UPF0313 family)
LGIKEIFIYDDTFTINRQRVEDICRRYQAQGLTIQWDVRARVNTVDENLLTLMKQSNCQRIHYGVEAGTQKVLDVMRKGITPEMVERAFAATKRAGITTAAYFMFGSPQETRADILQTIAFMKKIKPDFVHITVTTPFPATEMYLKGLQDKVIARDYWLDFARNPQSDFIPPAWPGDLSQAELFNLLLKAYKDFYFSPRFIITRLAQIRSVRELLPKIKAAGKLWQS